MHDVFTDLGFERKSVADFSVRNMILFPRAWAGFNSPVSLRWQQVRFSSARTREVPNDAGGVYTFVVQPGIANHPACSYLLYVGKTKRDFRVRYREYLAEQGAGERARRMHIAGMLTSWRDHLWFCYAPIGDESKIAATEDALIQAYLPPANREVPGVIKKHKDFYLGV